MFVPVSVSVPEPVLVSLPEVPEMTPLDVPAAIAAVPEPSWIVPPVRLAMAAETPVSVSEPELIALKVAVSALNVAPAKEPVKDLPTVTVPAARADEIVAPAVKEVAPAPPSEVSVVVPVGDVNAKLPAVVFAVVTAPRLRLAPEIAALPDALSVNDAAGL